MPHIDDGTLHALIDGALRADDPDRAHQVEQHIGRCEDCRARLDAARTLRGEADDLLAATAPDASARAAVPDFDEVRQRAASAGAGRTSGEPRPPQRQRASVGPARWTRRLSWAATVVLALGTGYLLRGLAGPEVPAAGVRQTGPDVEAFDASAGSGTRPGPGARSDAEALTRGGPDRERERAETATDPGAGPDPGASAAPGPAAGAPLAGASDDAPAGALAEEETQVSASPPIALEAPVEAARAAAARPAAKPAAKAAAKAGVSQALEGAVLSGTTVESEWRSATLEESAAALGGPVYVLPRAEVVDMLLSDRNGQVQVLTEQRLESGVPVRVLQRLGGAAADSASAAGTAPRAELDTEPEPARAADTPAADTPAADTPAASPLRSLPAPSRVEVVRGEFVLELQAALPAELLTILAGAARPAGEGRR